MAKFIIKTTVEVSSPDVVKKLGKIFNNIASEVKEKDIVNFFDKIDKDKNFLAKVISKLDNPLVKQFLG